METHVDNRIRMVIEWMSRTRALRRWFGRPYVRMNRWVWTHLPERWRCASIIRPYGDHLLHMIQLQSARTQNIGTFFFRNRPELELLIRLLARKQQGSTLDITILGCSKGAEVYSFSYSIRSARPDLNLSLHAVDINSDVLEFAKYGIYSLKSRIPRQTLSEDCVTPDGDLAAKTFGGQTRSVFERMSPEEIDEMFEREGEQVRVKPRFREGVTWHVGDAGDSKLVDVLGLQDIVVANRFLCHMQPEQAEVCLRNLSHLVKPGGYLFVSGVDLGVRSKVARELGWRPLIELINEIHEGDPSLRQDWPLKYWGLEAFDRRRNDWDIRYACVFQLGVAFPATIPSETLCENLIGVLAHRQH